MSLVNKILFSVTLLFTSQNLVARADVSPYFGVSGQYEGKIELNGTDTPATLSLVDFQNNIRGVINTKLKFKDSQGKEWEGTDIFVKGKRNDNGTVELNFSHHQCAAIAEICHDKRTVEVTNVLNFEIKKAGSDYVLFKLSLNGGENTDAPFSSAFFEMNETYVADAPNPQNPFFVGLGSVRRKLCRLCFARPTCFV